MPRTPGDPAIREVLTEILEEQAAYHANQAELHAQLHARARHQIVRLRTGRLPRVLSLRNYPDAGMQMRSRLSGDAA